MSEENKNIEEEQPISNEQLAMDEVISSGDALAEAEQPQTTNLPTGQAGSKPSTDNMDATNNPNSQAKKSWKPYAWEFLMVFLAVFCGFLAENLREQYVENQRAKVYAKSMLDNLQNDTEELKDVVLREEIAVNNLDTFLKIANQSTDISKIPTGKLYWYGLWGGYLRGFEPNDATFQQMKGSGSLSYFKNTDLEQKIGEYDQIMRSMTLLNQIDRNIYVETRKARARIFNFKYNNDANSIAHRIYRGEKYVIIDSFINTNPPLLTSDKMVFNEYIELCRSRNLSQHLEHSQDALKLAVEIIELLKKEYHLK